MSILNTTQLQGSTIFAYETDPRALKHIYLKDRETKFSSENIPPTKRFKFNNHSQECINSN